MNCFHRFIEDFEGGVFEHALLPGPIRSAICFEMPPLEQMSDLKEIPELMRPPYEICWFEGQGIGGNGKEGRICFLLLSDGDHIALGMYEYMSFSGPGGGFYEIENALYENGQWKCHPHASRFVQSLRLQIGENVLKPNLAYVSKFLSLLNCKNIGRVETKPSDDHQRRRRKQGRVPLFSYWTLVLKPTAPAKSKGQGDSHASPRLHLRRGHIRRLSEDRHVWVQACVVGNKERGIVHKDYAMPRAADTVQ